jgi:hypothetical protein
MPDDGPFQPNTTLTAEALNAAFGAITIPDSADLLGSDSDGTIVARVAGAGLDLNAGTVTADWQAGPVTDLGGGLTLVSGTVSANWQANKIATVGTGLGVTGSVLSADWRGGTVAAIGTGLTLTSGTLTAGGSGGTVTKVSTASGITGGPITNAGTISLDTRGASTLMGNPGTVAAIPSDITIGSGLSLSTAGTLTASGSGGTVTEVDTGTGLTGGPITGTGTILLDNRGTLTLMGNPGTTAAAPSDIPLSAGISLVTGTLTPNWRVTGSVTAINANAFLVSSGTLGFKQGPTIQVTQTGTTVTGTAPATVLSTSSGGTATFSPNLNFQTPGGSAMMIYGLDTFPVYNQVISHRAAAYHAAVRQSATTQSGSLPTASGDVLGGLAMGGFNTVVSPYHVQLSAFVQAVAIENWTSLVAGTRLDLLVTPAGGLTQITAVSLLDSGRVLINTASDDGTSFLQVNGRALMGTLAVGASTPFSAIGTNLSVTSGTLNATGGIGTIVAGTGLSGGTITTSGTVALATRTASTIMGNPGTAAATPTDVAIGSGLTLTTGGTLSATGANLVAGTGISINTGTIAAKQPIRTTIWNNALGSTNSIATAWRGGVFTAVDTVAITEVFVPLSNMASAGTYQAAISEFNGSNGGTVSVAHLSAIITGVSQGAQYMPGFSFSPPVTMQPGTIYAVMVGRTDQTGTFAINVPNVNGVILTESLSNGNTLVSAASATIAVGTTLATTGGNSTQLGLSGWR